MAGKDLPRNDWQVLYNIHMIDYVHLIQRKYHYLEGDPKLIENFEAAENDTTQTWVCHHRRELVPDRKSAEELVDMGLYWNRPPEELIFLTNSEHKRLHSTGENNPMHGKDSWAKCTPEERADRASRYSHTMKGVNSRKKFWTDGKTRVFARECPEGFHLEKFHYWNDGEREYRGEFPPHPGCWFGRLNKKT